MLSANVLSFFLVPIWLRLTLAFYLPGMAPTTYQEGDEVQLFVNHLTPGLREQNNKENHIFSYDYYFHKFHFCEPDKITKQPQSLGSVVFGDRIYNSPFKINMLKDTTCNKLCSSKIPKNDAKFINQLVSEDFRQNWIVDGLPAGREVLDKSTNTHALSSNFELGFFDSTNEANKYFKVPLFINHFDIVVEVYDIDASHYRVVGVRVNPLSLERNVKDSCDLTGKPKILNEKKDNYVDYTYSVKFEHWDTPWATRWDKYSHTSNSQIQWFSLVGMSVAVLFLVTLMEQILFRTLKKDFSRYEALNLDSDEFDQDSGWKLLHGDVFRAPKKLLLLSSLTGAGIQILVMSGTVILLACFGLLSPQNRGALPTFAIVLYALFAFIGAFTSMTVYRFFGGIQWKTNLILTSSLIPGSVFLTIIFLNVFLLCVHSSDALPFSSLCMLVGIWMLLSLPSSVLGSLLARKLSFKDNAFIFSSAPTKTNQIERQIPIQPTYLKTIPSALVAGIFPFGYRNASPGSSFELKFKHNTLNTSKKWSRDNMFSYQWFNIKDIWAVPGTDSSISYQKKMDRIDTKETEIEKKVLSEAQELQKKQLENDTIALLKREIEAQKENVSRLKKENKYLQEYVENLMDSIDLTKNS
ncbi:hypothetical protein ACO0RG_002495 [Hanseniaspora osmophila]